MNALEDTQVRREYKTARHTERNLQLSGYLREDIVPGVQIKDRIQVITGKEFSPLSEEEYRIVEQFTEVAHVFDEKCSSDLWDDKKTGERIATMWDQALYLHSNDMSSVTDILASPDKDLLREAEARKGVVLTDEQKARVEQARVDVEMADKLADGAIAIVPMKIDPSVLVTLRNIGFNAPPVLVNLDRFKEYKDKNHLTEEEAVHAIVVEESIHAGSKISSYLRGCAGFEELVAKVMIPELVEKMGLAEDSSERIKQTIKYEGFEELFWDIGAILSIRLEEKDVLMKMYLGTATFNRDLIEKNADIIKMAELCVFEFYAGSTLSEVKEKLWNFNQLDQQRRNGMMRDLLERL